MLITAIWNVICHRNKYWQKKGNEIDVEDELQKQIQRPTNRLEGQVQIAAYIGLYVYSTLQFLHNKPT